MSVIAKTITKTKSFEVKTIHEFALGLGQSFSQSFSKKGSEKKLKKGAAEQSLSSGGKSVSAFRSEAYMVIVSESARGNLTVDFKSFGLEDKTIYFLSPEQVFRLDLETNSRGVVIEFGEDFLERHGITAEFITNSELFFNCDDVPPLSVSKSFAEAAPILANISREHDREDMLRDESLGAWLKLFLIFCKRVKQHQEEKNTPLVKPQAGTVRRFKRLVETTYKAEHQVAFYAKALNLTPNYLNEVIHTETGVSAKAFILNRVMLEARRMAIYSDLQLKQLARQLGFRDVVHFGKLFKKCTGKSFSEFREKTER
jgi:AraC family transcriptional regulator, transcriptional activator of pobA